MKNRRLEGKYNWNFSDGIRIWRYISHRRNRRKLLNAETKDSMAALAILIEQEEAKLHGKRDLEVDVARGR